MSGAARTELAATRRAAFTAVVFCIIAPIASAMMMPAPLGSPLGIARMVQIGWNVLLALLLRITQRYVRAGHYLAVFGLAALPQLASFWLVGSTSEANGRPWEPFLRQKLLFFVWALLAPGENLVAATVIVAVAIESCLEYWVGGLGNSPSMTLDEPWLTLALAGVAICMLLERTRSVRSEQELAQRLNQVQIARRLARLSLAVRDASNTPLQTLELSVALLEDRHPGARHLIAIMHRSLARLFAVSRAFTASTAQLDWAHDEEALDPAAVLTAGEPAEPQPPAPGPDR